MPTMRFRLRTLIAALTVFVLSPLVADGQTCNTSAFHYNSSTGEYTMPGGITSVTSSSQCSCLQQQWDAIFQQIEAQHQKCLDANASAPTIPNSGGQPNSLCSKSSCQGLHDALYTTMKPRETEQIASCNQAAEKYEAEQQQLKAAEQQKEQQEQRQEQAAQQQRTQQLEMLKRQRAALISAQVDAAKKQAAILQQLQQDRAAAQKNMQDAARSIANQLSSSTPNSTRTPNPGTEEPFGTAQSDPPQGPSVSSPGENAVTGSAPDADRAATTSATSSYPVFPSSASTADTLTSPLGSGVNSPVDTHPDSMLAAVHDFLVSPAAADDKVPSKAGANSSSILPGTALSSQAANGNGATDSGAASAAIVTPQPSSSASVIVFGKQTISSPAVPGPDIQYENLDNPSHPSVISYQAAQQLQPLYTWVQNDPTNPLKYCNDPNNPCEIDYPGAGNSPPPRAQFSRPPAVTSPNSDTDCVTLQATWQQVLDSAVANHAACKANWENRHAIPRPGSDYGPGSLCAFQACQEVHNSMERIQAEQQAAVAACRQAIAQTSP